MRRAAVSGERARGWSVGERSMRTQRSCGARDDSACFASRPH
ncbi:hypothetical protein BMASAVP1_1089 [Burkholderia mallei SAVP1]|nr:hypothetical protein BMASAVP1_1089 [Burkholderia mallei SAVP1]